MNTCVQTTVLAHCRVGIALVFGSLCVGGVSADGLFLALPSPHLNPRISVSLLCLLRHTTELLQIVQRGRVTFCRRRSQTNCQG